MKYIITVIGAIVIFQHCYSQHVDLSVTERYFQITDSLRNNIPLSDESWQSFISMDGISQYISRQHLDSEMTDYRRNLEYVYMPRYDSLLKEYLKDSVTYSKAYILNEYKSIEPELKEYLRQIRIRPDIYLDSVYEYAYPWLPRKMQRTSPKTNIYFLPMFTEPAGNDYDILLCLYTAYYLDQIHYGAVAAHRLHHMLRRNKRFASPKNLSMYFLMAATLEEGLADLIDKPMPDTAYCPAQLKFGDQIMKWSENAVPTLDSMIKAHIEGKKPFDTVNVYSNMQVRGHVPGYQMSQVIVRNGLVDEMIRYADDPLRFFLLYNKAALMDPKKPPVYSDTTIAFIKKLSRKQRRN